jgi:hypothetical protein
MKSFKICTSECIHTCIVGPPSAIGVVLVIQVTRILQRCGAVVWLQGWPLCMCGLTIGFDCGQHNLGNVNVFLSGMYM